MPLFLLLVAVPVIEIALFVKIGGAIGVWPTLAVVLLSAAAGLAILRRRGLAALGEVQARLQEGQNPAPAMADGALMLVAGMLLLVPGFFTDALGLLLVIGPLRASLIRLAAARMTVVHAASVRTAGFGGRAGTGRGGYGGSATVEGEYEVVDAEAPAEESPGRPERSGWTRIPGEDGRR